MAIDNLKLDLYESRESVPLQTFLPGVYTQKLECRGNSILSTVFVHTIDSGASVKVEYIEATTGEDEGEVIFLEEHPLLTTAPQSSKILVTRMHNKPNIRITVTGGEARLGVYITVVASFASELDSALLFDGEDYIPENVKGLMIAGIDEIENQIQFFRFKDGKLQVDAEVSSDVNVTNVENLRQRILKSPFLTRNYVYLDFGTKNQRLSTLAYSATGETQSLLRTFSYTLEGTKYKLISDVWSVI